MRQTTSADPMPALSPATLRQNIEEMIERLLAMLDMLDGNPDLEEGGDLEPSLGWSLGMGLGSHDDGEDDSYEAS